MAAPFNSIYRRLLPALLVPLIAVFPGISGAESRLPDLGDESAALLSPREERQMGEDFMREARARLEIVTDAEASEYLRSLGRRVSRDSRTDPEIYFFLIRNPAINAFAVPGGFIGVHTGLLQAARSEAELSAVLAHETAHLTQRHIPRMLADSQKISGPAMAAILAGLLIAASGGQGGEAAIVLATAGLAQHQLNFTRSFEQEADRIGMQLLDAAGYDARSMPAFFERLDQANRLLESDAPEFMRTHPVTSRRIAESRDHAEKFAVRKRPDDSEFRHIQARLRVLYSSPQEALRYYQNRIEQTQVAEPADQYGFALALLAARKLEAARSEIRTLQGKSPSFLPYRLLAAEVELASGNEQGGLALLKSVSKDFPRSLAVIQKYAEALIQAKRYDEAWKLLDLTVRKNADEPMFYKLLATAAGESGRTMEAHRAYGEYYFRTGNPRAAVEQLELAMRYTNNSFYYTASLEARIREIREQSSLIFKKSGKPGTEKRK